MRNKPFAHLSQAGVDLAKRVGPTMGTFDYVVTSTLPRAAETATAMGFGIHEVREELSMMSDEILQAIAWDAGFKAFHEAHRNGGLVADYCRSLRTLVSELLAKIPDGSKLLIVSHGGIVEASLLGCVDSAEIAAWGSHIDYCEGVSFQLDSGRFRIPTLHRV
jgi:broad specificity phosphatase PhoE